MQKISSLLYAFVLLCFSFNRAMAQTPVYNSKDYKKQPLWIKMMDDPNANYYETIKAFREFWKDRVLPKEPNEIEGFDTFEKEVGLEEEGESKREREREQKKRARNNDQSTHMYASEVRAFKGWIQAVKPWVRADGSIVSDSERQAIIDAQAKELKELELKNGKK